MNTKGPVCFQTSGNSPGKFDSPYDGFISAIKMVHLFGAVTCDNRQYNHYSNWGCLNHSSHGPNDLNIFLVNKNKQILRETEDYTWSWYRSELFTSTSKEFVFSNVKSPLYVNEGFQFELWYGDDMKDRNEDYSQGESCADAYAHFV